MSSAPWWSGMARFAVVSAGLIGLFLALDASFLFVLILVGGLLGGNMHPYSGLFLFIVVPFLVASGAGAAWIAYLIWCDLSRARRAPAEDMVARV